MPTPLLRAKSARAPELRQEEDRRAENIANRMSETALRKKLESLFRPLFHMIDTDDDHSITLDEFRKVITTSFPGHKEKEAELMKLWWIDQDKEGMAKPLTAKGWVKQWCRYMRDTGTQHTKELLLATMVAINTNSDNANMTRVLSGCQESMIPMPSPRLSLSDCQDMKELVDTLWKTLDFGVGESGKNDVLDEFEMSFLKVPALHDIMSKLDTNADGCVSYIEWANFWEARLKDFGEEHTKQDLEHCIRRAKQLSLVFQNASVHVGTDDFDKGLQEVEDEKAKARNEMLCMGAVATTIAALAIGGTMWMTRRN